MTYLIRLFPNDAHGAQRPYILNDQQLTGSPPIRLRGLPWRALQSSNFCLATPDSTPDHALWLLNACQHLREAGMEPFDSSGPGAEPFGDASATHLDCADWIWSPAQGRWLGEARSDQGPLRAPLFAFWLEQALRCTRVLYDLNRLLDQDLARKALPKKIAPLTSSLPTPLLQRFQIEALGAVERDILAFALHASSPAPIAALDSLPSLLAQRIASASSPEAISALCDFDPSAKAALESLVIESYAPSGARVKPPRL